MAYIAGLVSILSPCVLPMLPMVLGGALQSHRHGPIALAAGLVLSFTGFGMFVATLGFSLGLTPQILTNISAALMLAVGLIMLSGTLQTRFAVMAQSSISGLSSYVSTFSPSTRPGQFLLGALLGAVWTPCVGPTLGAAIALAAQGQSIGYAATIMFLFAIGVVTPLIGLMYGTREVIAARKNAMASLANWIKPILGVLLIGISLLILTGLMTEWEKILLSISPDWLITFIYSF